jgi:Tol biopolymer transport system component
MSRSLAAVGAASLLLVMILAPIAQATFPDRNGRIAFQAATDAGIQIFSVRANGHDLRQVTHLDGDATTPDWSADGRQLTFTVDGCSIAFIDADGTNLRILPPAAGDGVPGQDVCDGDSSFSPDGERVVYGHYNAVVDKEDVRSMRLDGTDRVLVTDQGGPDPNVSPDGSKVSFKGADGALFTANIDGGDLTQVSPTESVAYKSDWAPDGNHLVFSDNSEPGPQDVVNIALVRPDGTDQHYITHFTDPGLYAYVGSYSPDGQWIVFRLTHGDPIGLYRMRPDGSDVHEIASVAQLGGLIPRNIDWGPASH